MWPDLLDCDMSPAGYESWKALGRPGPVHIMSYSPDTISQLRNPAGGFEVTDMCLIAILSPPPTLEARFPRYFPTLLSLNTSVGRRKSFFGSKLDFLCAGLDSLCRRLIHLIAINWCSTRFKQRDGPTLAFCRCVDLWGNENRISLSSTIRTGAIKRLRLVAMELWLEPRNA